MKSTSLLAQCMSWLSRKDQLLIGLLVIIVGISSIGVILSSFTTRKMYADLQALQLSEDEIDSEYGKLLLEYSAWANYARVERVSKEDLHMIFPSMEDMVLVDK